MENLSLYEYIEKLKQAKENLNTLAKKLRYEGVPIETIRKEIGGRIKQIEDRLDDIANKYAIDYQKLIQIINKKLNKKHKLKCFREFETIWEVNEGSKKPIPIERYTGRYLMGFISQDNKFYNYKENDLGYSSLTPNEYNEMLQVSNKENSIVLNASEDFGLHRMFVLDLVKNKNYIQMLTHNDRYYNDFYSKPLFKILDIISEELKHVEFNQEDTTTEDLRL